MDVVELRKSRIQLHALLSAAQEAVSSRSHGELYALRCHMLNGSVCGHYGDVVTNANLYVPALCEDPERHYFPMISWFDKPVSDDLEYSIKAGGTYAGTKDPPKRIRGKFGKFVKKYIPGIPDHAIADIVEAVIGAQTFNESNFSIVTGDAIEECYREDFGNSSCMTGEMAECVRIYANNPDKVALLLHDSDAHGRGRALLWTNESGDKLLDRVYSSCYVSRKYHMWAQKYGVPFHETWEDTPEFSITLKMPDNGFMPYMDTMKNGILSSNGKSITLYSHRPDVPPRKHLYHLRCTDGGPFNCIGAVCSCCGEMVREDDCYYTAPGGETLCASCYGEHVTCCEECGDEIYIEDSRELDYTILCEYCYDSATTTCDRCGDTVSKDEIITTHDGDEICECCQRNYEYCSDCGEYFHESDLDDDGLCEDCREDKSDDDKEEE